MTSARRSQRANALMLSAVFTLVGATGCSQDPPPGPDSGAAAPKLGPGSTVCKILPTDLAIKTLSKFPGGLTESDSDNRKTEPWFVCSVDAFRHGLRYPAIEVQLWPNKPDWFVKIRKGLQTPPYITLPPTLGEGYATDSHVGLLRPCRGPVGGGDQTYLIMVGLRRDTAAVIPRADLAKVITDAVPFLDKRMGCAPATAK